MLRVEANAIDGGKALGERRRFELFVGGDNATFGDACLAAARGIAGDCISERRLEIIGDALEMRGAGGREVFCPRGGGGVGVVNHAGLFCLQAGVKKQRFAVACAQHIEIEADVRVGKMRFVVAAFARCLHAAEKEELHRNQLQKPNGPKQDSLILMVFTNSALRYITSALYGLFL